jgi:hypothetical protein
MSTRLVGLANRAICVGGLLQGLVGAYVVYRLELPIWSVERLAAMGVIMGTYIASIYAGLATALRLWHREADEIDRAALACVESGGRYFLYLRSFEFENDVRLREDSFEAWMRTCWTRALRTSPRFYVAMALKQWGPTLGIGGVRGPGMTLYTSSDMGWQQDFVRLAEGAAGIFVLPSVTPGSAWELDWLCVNTLDKTVFLFPPQYAVSRDAWDPFWDHYVEFINRYTGFGEVEENVFSRRSGHVFMLHDWRQPLPEGAARVARAWRFSGPGFDGAAQFLVEQAGRRPQSQSQKAVSPTMTRRSR